MRCRVEGVPRFALSFDDGPSPAGTPRLLEALRELETRATFFMLGVHVLRHPAIARRVASEGHEIGLHGHHHRPPALLPRALLRREIETGMRVVGEATGAPPRLYRAPFGWLTRAQAAGLRGRGLEPVLGDVYPGDHARPGAERIAGAALERLRAGSILILHDASAMLDFDRGQTIAAVRAIVPAMRARGIPAGTVGELLAAAPP